MEFKNITINPVGYIQNLFFTGIIFLLPLTITFALFSFFFNVIKSWLIPIRKLNIPFVNIIPHHEIILLILFIFIIGVSLQAFFARPLIELFEKCIRKIPGVGTIYLGTKQLVHAFTANDQKSFKKVVIVQYPRPGVYSIGFLTKDIPAAISPKTLVGVYIPHTPNPASGNFIMIAKDEIHETDLTRHEATALVISGGIVQPSRFNKPE